MAIQPAVCSNCGGRLAVDDIDLNGFCKCEFCGSTYKAIDVITVDGLPTVKSLLMNADFAIDEGNAERAVNTYKEVLKIKPNCHEAWWGLYICNRYFDEYYGYCDKYGNSGPITKACIMSDTINKYAAKAIEFAPPEQKQVYQNNIRPELDFIEKAKSGAFDKKTSSGSSGCYIATAVYGSYTCSEVVALRRYRDDYLAKRFFGRMFIKFYYSISPTLAKHISPNSKLGGFIRKYLDKKIKRLSL